MNNTAIYANQDYKTALREISKLMALDPELGTSDGDKLDALVTLVQAYESEHYTIASPCHMK
jgi:HTH-type transcriptional regulator/antitoxin HigA